ncbi:MAG: ADP-ribosylglycohydrolase family protein [Firmicutes bacterium]|nr:ADP-ribosylglycohydrolase family protein [Bacillota bacterium]
MYGAIIGDIAGSEYEFSPTKDKNFKMFGKECEFTDDSVMTTAVAEALLDLTGDEKEDDIKDMFVGKMKRWGRRYPRAGYGGRFIMWLMTEDTKPYNSYGNGSAMRVSPVGWLYDDLETTRKMARLSAEVTHDHPEGIKGAESTAAAIFMARNGASKVEIKEYIEKEFGYDLDRTCNEIRPGYYFDVTCQGSVPEAFIAFLEGESYEDVIREAVSLGGDADTQAAIAGSIAEAFYGIPENLKAEADKRMTDDMKKVVKDFYARI